MKKYLVGVCFAISSLTHAAAEPNKIGCCCKLALDMVPVLPFSRVVYPYVAVPWMGDRPRITDKGWLSGEELTSCEGAPQSLYSRIFNHRAKQLSQVSDNLKKAQMVLDRHQQKLDRCLAEFPEQAQNKHVREAQHQLKQQRLDLILGFKDLDECRKLLGN